MVTNNSPRSIFIAERNKDRRNTISELYEGCRDNDETKIRRATLKLSIPAGSPMDHGFSVHDLYHYLEPITNRLNGIDGNKGLREILAYKKEQLRRHNVKLASNNGAGNTVSDIQHRIKLSRDVHDLSIKVSFLSRIEGIITEQLRRHGEIIAVMQEERPATVAVVTR
jgi:hypothetical protein